MFRAIELERCNRFSAQRPVQQLVYGIYHNPIRTQFTIIHLAFSIWHRRTAMFWRIFSSLPPICWKLTCQDILNLGYEDYIEFAISRIYGIPFCATLNRIHRRKMLA